MQTIDVISTFSGIEGFGLGLERAGMRVVAQAEIDKFASKVLAHHYPHLKNYGDVNNVTEYTGTVNLICGGFPCQDLSVAGKRAGLAGKRSGLWFAFRAVIAHFRPRWVIIENVPGLLSSHQGRDMATVLQGLEEFGYGWAYRVLDAQYFGVAQRRRRVFIVGCLGDARSAAKVLFEPQSSPGDPPPSREARQETTGYLTARAGKDGSGANGQLDKLVGYSENLSKSLSARSHKSNREDSETYIMTVFPDSAYAVSGQGSKFGSGRHNQDTFIVEQNNAVSTPDKISLRSNPAQPLVAFQQNTRDEVRLVNGDGNIAGAIASQPGMKQQNYIWEMSHPDDVVRESGEIAPILNKRMGTGGNQVPLVGVRRLMPVECERLQGFPDGWTDVDGMSDTQRYKQLGNAVAVPVIEWIGKRIIEQDRIIESEK